MLNLKLILAVTLLLATTVQAETCPTRRQRLEFRQLTNEQRQSYINAIKNLQRRSSPNSDSKYDVMMRDHVAVTTYAHGCPRFLSWHRAFLRDYEKALLAAGSPVLLPYWDWAYDSQAPHLSIIFDRSYLGGNGAPSNNNCVPDGAFTDWKPRNQRGCLARRFDNGDRINPLWGPEALQTLFGTDDYDTFRQRIEGPHGNVHNGVGDVFSTMEAASDPLFYMHHAFVDKLWADWQKGNPTRLNSYTGVNDNGSPANRNDDVGYGYRAQDVLDTNNLCYTYRDFNGDTTPVTPPTDTTTPGTNTTTPVDNTNTTTPGGTNTTTPGGTNTTTPGGTNTTTPGGSNTTTPGGSNTTVPIGNTTIPSNVNVSVPGVITQPANGTGNNNSGAGNSNTGVGNSNSGSGNSNTPANNDYGNIINIRPPVPLPEEWCRRNGVNINLVRHLETVAKTTVDTFNKLPGYVSRAALVNHRAVLDKLAARGLRFYGFVGNKKVTFQSRDTTTVRNAAAAVAGQVKGQVSFTYPSIVKKVYASNPPIPRFPPSTAPRTNPIAIKSSPPQSYGGAPIPSGKLYGAEEVSYGNTSKVADYNETADDEECEDEDDYDDEAPSTNTTTYTPTPAPAANDTYGDKAPSTNTTAYTPTPAPAANETYGGAAPAPSKSY